MDVVYITQSKQAGEQATGQHSHSQVKSNGQTLSDDATAWAHSGYIKNSLLLGIYYSLSTKSPGEQPPDPK